MARAGGYKPSYDETVKILLIGESSVGKSSLLIRFAEDSFSPELLSTVGIDYKIKTKVPIDISLNKSITSLFFILMQPCDEGIPILPSSDVPCM